MTVKDSIRRVFMAIGLIKQRPKDRDDPMDDLMKAISKMTPETREFMAEKLGKIIEEELGPYEKMDEEKKDECETKVP